MASLCYAKTISQRDLGFARQRGNKTTSRAQPVGFAEITDLWNHGLTELWNYGKGKSAQSSWLTVQKKQDNNQGYIKTR